MEWYLPMTIIPGIGLIILSTSNIMLELNREISKLEEAKHEKIEIIKLKLSQLKVLNISIVFQYLGVLLFLLSGIASPMYIDANIPKGLLFIGVAIISVSILFLLYYSIKSVNVRQKHLKLDK